MNNLPEIIDLKFGLSQLSGNHALLVKLLGKFKNEYNDLPERLSVMQNSNDISSYRAAVHTIKGVSGNLGLNAIHEIAKKLEISLMSDLDVTDDFREFKSVLEETCRQIEAMSDETELEGKAEPVESPEVNAKQQLSDTLKRNEFLPPERLNVLLEACNFSTQDKQQLENAISDLDYPEALRLISSV